MSEKNEKPLASYISIVVAVALVVLSAGWFVVNLDKIFGPFFDREDPTPTAIPATPDGAVEAFLYAECQEQLKDALDGIALAVPEEVVEANAEYLNEARKAIVRLEDLNMRGRSMFDELKAREDDTPDEYRDEWNEKARKFRADLYRSVVDVRRLGMSDPYTRLQSEIFLAYHWLDRYSDQINGIFTDRQFDSISDEGVTMSGLHLETTNVLLQSSQ